MKHLPDLRALVAELDAIGEITHVSKEVDWNLKLGAVARRSYELRALAPLLVNIAGVEKCFRVLAAPGGLSAQSGHTSARVAPGVRGQCASESGEANAAATGRHVFRVADLRLHPAQDGVPA